MDLPAAHPDLVLESNRTQELVRAQLQADIAAHSNWGALAALYGVSISTIKLMAAGASVQPATYERAAIKRGLITTVICRGFSYAPLPTDNG